ncbi:MAG TPA: pilus assembly protein PilO [Deltaproteobacteria bacterium]|jgi:type IV pilus assembly protein PilO|nr:pilus assembly protein PilO [Deltaproteobacteria bacterium]
MELGLERLQGSLDKLTKLPRPYRMGIVLGIIVIVFGLYAYVLYAPARAQLEGLRKQELELQRQLNEVRSVTQNLGAFEEELGRLDRELTIALRQLPNSKELPVLLTDISTLGKNAGLEFKSFKPKPEIPRDFYSEVPIEIEFHGHFHEVAGFFDQISRLPRIVNVSELKMKVDLENANETLLFVQGNATTFRFLESGSAPAHDTAAPAGAGSAPAVPKPRAGGGGEA